MRAQSHYPTNRYSVAMCEGTVTLPINHYSVAMCEGTVTLPTNRYTVVICEGTFKSRIACWHHATEAVAHGR